MRLSPRPSDPLIASMFIVGGWDSFTNPEGKVKEAEAVTKPLHERFPALPDDTATFVKFNGAVQMAAGALLVVGRMRRLAALALIGSLVPTTYAGHRFWEEIDDEAKDRQRMQFFKNLSMLGGLGAVVLGGRSGHGRTRHRNVTMHKAADRFARGSRAARSLIDELEEAVSDQAPKVARAVQDQAPKIARAVQDQAPRMVDAAGNLASSSAAVSKSLASKAGGLLPTS